MKKFNKITHIEYKNPWWYPDVWSITLDYSYVSFVTNEIFRNGDDYCRYISTDYYSIEDGDCQQIYFQKLGIIDRAFFHVVTFFRM